MHRYDTFFTTGSLGTPEVGKLGSTFMQVIEYLKNNPEAAKQSYEQAQRIMQVSERLKP